MAGPGRGELRFADLPTPLHQINALDLADASQVYQLLENLGAQLDIEIESPSALGNVITPVVAIAGVVDKAETATDATTRMERELLLDLVMKERLSTLADLHMDTERRLGKVLVQHAQKCGSIDGPYWLIKDRVSHEELALLAGTTRPRVTAYMQRFRMLGIIDLSYRSLRVHREKALKLVLQGVADAGSS